MLHWILSLSLIAVAQDPPAEQEPAPEAEAEQEELTPEKAVELLEAAEKSKQFDLILAALEETGRVADKKVVKEISGFLKHKDAEIRYEAIRALRYNQDESAIDALLKVKKTKEIIEDDRLAEEYYYALGQHGDKKAIKVLADNLNKTNRGDKVTRARILALGRIREVESVEALMDCLVSGAARRRHPQLTEIHTALTVLTGAEVRPNQDAWIAWWNDNKRGLELTKSEQELTTKKARAAWMTLWATPEDQELMKEAAKRGKDGFADATPEELEEMRKKAEERKKRAEEKAKEEAEGGTKDGDTPAGGDGSGDGR